MFAWIGHHWEALLQNLSIIVGLSLPGYVLWRDARVRRAQTLIEMIKLHRELWTRYDEKPALHGLFDVNRDLEAHPLADEEVRFANFLFLHLRGAYHARRAGIYRYPDRLRDDLKDMLSYPAVHSAWQKQKRLLDPDFVAFVEKADRL